MASASDPALVSSSPPAEPSTTNHATPNEPLSNANQPQDAQTADSPASDTAEPAQTLEKDLIEEHASRKRERDSSLEPSSQASASIVGPPESLPLKKNRLQDAASSPAASATLPASLAEEIETADDADPESKKDLPETEKVGQIRKQVQDLTWKEGKDPEATKSETALTAASDQPAESAKTTSSPAPAVPKSEAKASTDSTATPVRTQPTFSSFSAKASPFSSVPTSSGSSSASSKSGFASASPFKAFGAKGTASPFASAGGIKPSSLGSSLGAHHGSDAAGASSAKPPPAGTPAASAPKGPNLGFGAFAGASPLKKPISKQESKDASPKVTEEKGETAAATESAPSSSESFSDKLLDESTASSTDAKHEGRPTLGTPELEVVTGEEDEQSVYSVRAKLYTMTEDQSWKERGTGTIRVNVPKDRGGKPSARLVMRADGVLRLILNVSLFPGMKCELQEKFVRIVAFEDGSLAHFAIKMSNPTNAVAFMDAVQRQIAKLA